jgi:hypothetical protein
MFKVIGHMGDGLENIILGLISSILPINNLLAQQISQTSQSNYHFQETIKSAHAMFQKQRIYSIEVCRKGCVAFIGANEGLESCSICDSINHSAENDVVYYFPLTDRIKCLLESDLNKFVSYPPLRPPSIAGYIEDVYDGENWKWFENQMRIDRLYLIFILY